MSNFGCGFRLSKAMIALLFDLVLPQSASSTSQPRQQKGLCRQLPPTPHLSAKHSITQAVASLRGLNDPLIAGAKAQRPRHLFAASKTHSLSPSSSLDVLSTNDLPEDRPCLVCSIHSSASCPVCEEDFCSDHLYPCLDCDSQYCGSCLDDHCADGHWTDSDTNAELNHGWREKLVDAAQARVKLFWQFRSLEVCL